MTISTQGDFASSYTLDTSAWYGSPKLANTKVFSGFGELRQPPSVNRTTVKGHDLRVGDFVVYVTDTESYYDERVIRCANGFLGYDDGVTRGGRSETHPGGKWKPEYDYEVRTPRPEPEANEFGPVCP